MLNINIEWREGLTLQVAEGYLLKSALEKHNYDIRATAKALGICRASVYKKVLKLLGTTIMELRRGRELPTEPNL